MPAEPEQWLDVPDYEGFYQVSSHGRIFSTRAGRCLSPAMDEDGRSHVNLCVDGQPRTFRVARLVLTAFGGPAPEGTECCHSNGDNTDNAASNLYWGTRSENIVDSVRHGTQNNTRKTECPQGHCLDEESNRQAARTDAGERSCRACGRARSRVRYWSKKGVHLDFRVEADKFFDEQRRTADSHGTSALLP